MLNNGDILTSTPTFGWTSASDSEKRPIDTSGIFPAGLLRSIYGIVQPGIEAILGFPDLWARYDSCRHGDPDAVEFSRRFLDASGVAVDVESDLVARLAQIQGPLVLAANHPFGGMEFFALVGIMEAIRPGGWRFLANPLVTRVPGFEHAFIPLDPLNSGSPVNRRGLAAAMGHLREGGLLGLFPAGRVSLREKPGWTVTDLPWSDHAVRLAGTARASIAIVHVPGANSRLFQRIPVRLARLRGLMLAREIAKPQISRLSIRSARIFGEEEVTKLIAGGRAGVRMQAWCHLRAAADSPRPPTSAERQSGKRADHPGRQACASTITEAIRSIRSTALVHASGDFDLLFLRGDASPVLIESLGRLRAVTFGAAGQGSGLDLDLGREDDYYHHLLLWDRSSQRLAGAYRAGIVEEILRSRGPRALYLDGIFEIHRRFYGAIGPAFELSRSFVHPDYQRDNRALAALWRGLGAAAARHGIRTLFGSVTISNEHHPATRSLLVEHLRRNHADTAEMRRLVKARRPLPPAPAPVAHIAEALEGEPLDALAPFVASLEDGQRGIPPLIRHYCRAGARFLSYQIEPSFADALYCLLRVDLAAIPPGHRRRFLPCDT